MWADEESGVEWAVGNGLAVILKWFETKVDEAWPQVRRIQQLMTIKEVHKPTGPGGYEGYTKLLTRVNRSRMAAKYDSLSPDIKFNMYLFGLLRNPKLKEQMIRKAGKDKDAFKTPWMKKQWNEYYTSTITSPAELAKPMQQPGLMTNKSMSQKNNQNNNTNNKARGVI